MRFKMLKFAFFYSVSPVYLFKKIKFPLSNMIKVEIKYEKTILQENFLFVKHFVSF